MSRKSLQKEVDKIYDQFEDEEDIQEAFSKHGIIEKTFDPSGPAKIVNFLIKCMDHKVSVVESPDSNSSEIIFLYKRKDVSPEVLHCGRCNAVLPKKELRHITDYGLAKDLELTGSSYVCEDCIESYWNDEI